MGEKSRSDTLKWLQGQHEDIENRLKQVIAEATKAKNTKLREQAEKALTKWQGGRHRKLGR